MARRPSSTLRVIENPPRPEEFEPTTVDVPSDEIDEGVTFKDGVLQVEHEDGSTTIDFDPPTKGDDDDDDDFYSNLISKLKDGGDSIASDLIDGIDRDIESRKEWIETEARGIQLLGLHLEEPRGDLGAGSAPLEGMSTVRHPLLLEATLNFQATAIGEFLPAGGPVKVRNDTPPKAPSQAVAPQGNPPGLPGMGLPGMGPAPVPGIGHNGGPAMGFADGGAVGAPAAPQGVGSMPQPPQPSAAPQTSQQSGDPKSNTMPNPAQEAVPTATEVAIPEIEELDTLAEALEKDFNHYLTVVATEYVPETDRMFFGVGFRGDGFKKIYNCPLRRRPVIEIIDTKDFIVSNNASNLENCSRITHRIKMPLSTLKRMQILGVYADVPLDKPVPQKTDAIDTQVNAIEGTNPAVKKPEDLPYEIYESYCELDLDEFAPEALKGKGLPLPYRVTIEVGSKKILSIIRNWKEDDDLALPKQYFVQYPFVRGLGFYGIGFVHILGNTTLALTAMWREMVDSGMFSNFPGFLYIKALGRQLTNNMRVPPGGGLGIDAPISGRIQDAVMPLPYKDISSAFTSFAQWIEQDGQRLGQTAQIQVGEAKQDAPVGTTLALIEQATKLTSAVHKRLHGSQDKEFQLLKERFKEDPEAFWRHNDSPRPSGVKWEKEQFLKALKEYNLVPVADPNNPTSLHRTAKAAVIEGLSSKYPLLINQQAALKRVFRVANIDEEGLFYPKPLPPPPDPRMEAIKAKGEQIDKTNAAQQQTTTAKSMANVIVQLKQLEDRQQDRASKERIEQMRHTLEQQQAQQEMANNRFKQITDIQLDGARAQQEMQVEHRKTQQEMWADLIRQAMEMQAEHVQRGEQHQADMAGRVHEHQVNRLTAAQEHFHEDERHRKQEARLDEAHKTKLAREKELNNEKIRAARAMARATPKAKTK